MSWAKAFAYFGLVLIVWGAMNMLVGRDSSPEMEILGGIQSLTVAASIAAAHWAWRKWGDGK